MGQYQLQVVVVCAYILLTLVVLFGVFSQAICSLALLVLFLSDLPPPYFCVDPDSGEYLRTTLVSSNSSAAKDAGVDAAGDGMVQIPAEPCNPSASTQGGKFALWMCAAAFGYVVAGVLLFIWDAHAAIIDLFYTFMHVTDVAADGLTVE
jgi:hypothetical protein